MNEKIFLKISIISFIIGLGGLFIIEEFINIESQKELRLGEKTSLEGYITGVSKFGGGFKLKLKNEETEILIFTDSKWLDVSKGEKVKVYGYTKVDKDKKNFIADRIELFSLWSSVK